MRCGHLQAPESRTLINNQLFSSATLLQTVRTQEFVSKSALVARAAKMLITARALEADRLHTNIEDRMARWWSCLRMSMADV